IETPFSVDRWQFSAASGQAVQLDLAAAASGLRFRLAASDGSFVFNDLATDSEVLPLPQSGEYTLTAYGSQGQTGDYTFELLSQGAIDLPLNVPFHGTIAGSGQFQLFRVQFLEPTPLLVRLDDTAADHRNELYVNLGSAPTRSSVRYQSTDATADQRVTVPLAAPGTWYVLVYSEAAPGPSSFQLLATGSPVLVSNVTPDRLGTATESVLSLTGAGFEAGTK